MDIYTHKFIDDTTLSEIVQKGSNSHMQRALDRVLERSQLNHYLVAEFMHRHS